MKKKFTPPPAIYGLVALLTVSPVSASIGDNLSGSLLEAVESVGTVVESIAEDTTGVAESVSENTASIEELKEKVEAIGESTTSIQYNVSAANGNKVTIPAQPTVSLGTEFDALQQSFYDWVEEEYSVLTETDYYEVLDGSLDKDYFSKVVFRDKVSGYEFSINGYDSKKDELRLWMRQIVGSWKQVAPYNYESGHDHPACPITLTNALATEKFQVWKENNCEREGILSKVSSVNTGLNYCSTESQKSIPEENRSYLDGKKSVTWDNWWVGSSWRYEYVPEDYVTHNYGYLHYTGLTSGAFEYHYTQDAPYGSYAYCYTSPEYGFAPGLVLQGDLGEYESLKTLAKAWQVYSNTVSGKLGTGLVVPCNSFEPVASSELKNGGYRYALNIDDTENNLTSICDSFLLTGTAGGSLSIPYTCTMSTKKVTNASKYGIYDKSDYKKFVDIVIRNEAKEIVYWGRVCPVRMGDGLATFTVPKSLKQDSVYTLQMFSECCWFYDGLGAIVSTISTPVNMQLVIGE